MCDPCLAGVWAPTRSSSVLACTCNVLSNDTCHVMHVDRTYVCICASTPPACIACEPGHYKPAPSMTGNTERCQACAEGLYQPEAAVLSCESCPLHEWHTALAATARSQCLCVGCWTRPGSDVSERLQVAVRLSCLRTIPRRRASPAQSGTTRTGWSTRSGHRVPSEATTPTPTTRSGTSASTRASSCCSPTTTSVRCSTAARPCTRPLTPCWTVSASAGTSRVARALVASSTSPAARACRAPSRSTRALLVLRVAEPLPWLEAPAPLRRSGRRGRQLLALPRVPRVQLPGLAGCLPEPPRHGQLHQLQVLSGPREPLIAQLQRLPAVHAADSVL